MRKFNVAVVGATGAVGEEVFRVMEELNFPVNKVIPLASARSAGSTIEFLNKDITVLELTETVFEEQEVEIAFFCAGGSISEKFAKFAVEAGAVVIDSEEQEILTVSEKGIGKRTTIEEYRLTNRAGSGVIAMKLSPKTGNIVGEVLVDDTQDLMLLTSIGKMIRVDMQTIRKAGRNTSGVIIVNVDKDDKVVSIAKCPKEDEELELDENGNVIRYNEDGEVIESSKEQEENLLDIIDNKEEE